MKYQRGFSLVELMVGTVISLLVTLTVAGSAQFLDIQKRVTMGTNVTLENLAVTYNQLANDVRLAGFGTYKCGTTTFNLNGTLNTVTDMNSLYITKGTSTSANPNSDTVTLMYGESSSGVSYTSISTISTGSVTTTNYLGQIIAGGKMMVQNTTPPATPTNCSIVAINSVSSSTTSGITTSTITASDSSNLMASSTYPTNSSVVTGLSDLKYVTISVDKNNNLTEVDAVSGVTTIISSNIVFFKAYYGLNDGTFQEADNSSGTDWSQAGMTSANRDKVKSLRFYVIARAPVLNKPNATTGVCDTTTTVPKSWDTDLTIDLSKTTTDDWKCYRYQAGDFIIPLKNKVLFDFSHAS